MEPISSVNVFCGDGTTCYFDNITPLYSDCGKIIIPIGTYPHQVEVNPTAITIIPTRPTVSFPAESWQSQFPMSQSGAA